MRQKQIHLQDFQPMNGTICLSVDFCEHVETTLDQDEKKGDRNQYRNKQTKSGNGKTTETKETTRNAIATTITLGKNNFTGCCTEIIDCTTQTSAALFRKIWRNVNKNKITRLNRTRNSKPTRRSFTPSLIFPSPSWEPGKKLSSPTKS